MIYIKNLILKSLIDSEIGDKYGVAYNLTNAWSHGSSVGFFMSNQLLTGIILSTFYSPELLSAFPALERVMRDVKFGWFFRYAHANGASFYFFSMYMHMSRSVFYTLYRNNKSAWTSGMFIFVLSMATAFIGYVLPWGQMSIWGATVITNLFSAIPVCGKDIVHWAWGGFSVSAPTLNRFYGLHYLLPFVLVFLVLIHLLFLHFNKSSGPVISTQLIKKIFFVPYFTLKDLYAVLVVLLVFSYVLLQHPNFLGHADNWIQGNPLVTPAHIVPEWYFLPFYAILRSIPDKLYGVLSMFLAIVVLFLLPILNVKPKYISFSDEPAFVFFFIIVVCLGWVGSKPVSFPYDIVGFYFTIFYFLFFIFIFFIRNFPFYSVYSLFLNKKDSNEIDILKVLQVFYIFIKWVLIFIIAKKSIMGADVNDLEYLYLSWAC